MTGSVQPVSSAAMSALIWELDSGAEDIFGPSPIGDTSNPSTPGIGARGKLARVLQMLRRRVLPRVVQSMNMSKITIIYRTRIGDPDDPLASQESTATAEVFAVVSGPTAENLENGFLSVSDYEVLIPAISLNFPLDESDSIEIDTVKHDIVGFQAHPKTPAAVAYRYMIKRAA